MHTNHGVSVFKFTIGKRKQQFHFNHCVSTKNYCLRNRVWTLLFSVIWSQLYFDRLVS